MPTNAQTALTNRQYYMIHGDWGPPAKAWPHSVTPGKPDAPTSFNALTQGEKDDLQKCLKALENGVLVEAPVQVVGMLNLAGAGNLASLTAAARAVFNEFVAYYARPDVVQWLWKDRISREAQWKIFNADVHDEIERSNVVPAANTTSGIGSNATSPYTPPAT